LNDKPAPPLTPAEGEYQRWRALAVYFRLRVARLRDQERAHALSAAAACRAIAADMERLIDRAAPANETSP